jgi:Ser/Thr protein kinase RdoA (MazF antagonist)
VRAEAAAHAFGGFIADLADLAPDSLRATIPGFHDLPARIRALESAIATDATGRLATARDEVDAAQRHAERILAGRDPEALPQRVVHNDCKINNLLFDADTDEPLCVVDLDTVMAGSALYDFGELVRTGASTASEDERDLPRVRFDLALFRPLVAGFVAGGRGAFTAEEIDAFAEAGPRMALENAVRFLADHLEGDRYFRVHRAGHNLDRARVQLRLLESMRDAETDVRAILAGLSGAAS